jgi:hypothetical protein
MLLTKTLVMQLIIQEGDMMGCMLPEAVRKKRLQCRPHRCKDTDNSTDGSNIKIRALCQRDGTSDYSC